MNEDESPRQCYWCKGSCCTVDCILQHVQECQARDEREVGSDEHSGNDGDSFWDEFGFDSDGLYERDLSARGEDEGYDSGDRVSPRELGRDQDAQGPEAQEVREDREGPGTATTTGRAH